MVEAKRLICETIHEWRSWLEKNHLKEERVMLVRYKKHTGKPYFHQRDAMNEAICFGWIDTTLKRIDDNLYGVNFVKRKKTSKWSDATFARAKEMISQGKMSDFGMKMYQEGLQKPTHDHGIPKNPNMPKQLNEELQKQENKIAKTNFKKFSKSQKRMFYRWILSAKLPETRKKRVNHSISRANQGKKFLD